MTYNDFHISDFSSNRLFLIKLFILGLFSPIIIKITKRVWFRTGTFKRMAKTFNRVHSDNVELLEFIQSGKVKKENAGELYSKADKVLKKLIDLHQEFENDNYFGSQVLEESFERALLSFYKVESHLKAIATADVNCSEQDAPLIQFASNISLGSLHA